MLKDRNIRGELSQSGRLGQRHPRDPWILQWATKGVIGGALGLVMTLGIQQADTIRERQRIARLFLPEIEHNFELSKELIQASEHGQLDPAGIANVKFERRVYEAASTSLGNLPPDLTRQIYQAYEVAAVLAVRSEIARQTITESQRIARTNEMLMNIIRTFDGTDPFIKTLKMKQTDWDMLTIRLRGLAASRWWLNWLE